MRAKEKTVTPLALCKRDHRAYLTGWDNYHNKQFPKCHWLNAAKGSYIVFQHGLQRGSAPRRLSQTMFCPLSGPVLLSVLSSDGQNE